ncbi:MAG TPA: cytochrome c [Lacunisphaera sp.]|nr:cytochrome c [Lacunisphaera sp.]
MKTTTKLMLFSLILPAAACVSYAASADENWENSCASCHGADGKGQTKQGKKLKLRDYSDPAVQAEMKDPDMLKAILEGVKDKDSGKERMKSFKDEISEAEAKDLVAFVRKLKG